MRWAIQRTAHDELLGLFQTAVAPLNSGTTWATEIQVRERIVLQEAPEQVVLGDMRLVQSSRVDPDFIPTWDEDKESEAFELDLLIVVNWEDADPVDGGQALVRQRAYVIADAVADALDLWEPSQGVVIDSTITWANDSTELPTQIEMDFQGCRAVLDGAITFTVEA